MIIKFMVEINSENGETQRLPVGINPEKITAIEPACGETIIYTSDEHEYKVTERFDVVINRINNAKPLNFPSLEECYEYVRAGMSDKKLSGQDEHCIGSVWAFIEGHLGLDPDDDD